jgi:hypothetical protein
MNKKDIDLISEAYNKVGNIKESFNYMDLAKEILHAAEEHINEGVRHTFSEIWSGSKDYDMVLERYVDGLRDLVNIAENLKSGKIEKVKSLYKGLDQVIKDELPKSFLVLVSQAEDTSTEEEVTPAE